MQRTDFLDDEFNYNIVTADELNWTFKHQTQLGRQRWHCWLDFLVCSTSIYVGFTVWLF